MSLLKHISRDELPTELVELYDHSLAEAGEADFLEVGAHAPELLDWYFNSFYKRVFYEGRVDVRTKELLRLKLSKTHGCFF
jgi:alkylhydroperoxidase family enzyme